ncbi:putative 60S acidic ribosomal protein P2 [Leishmania infantum JPCM5]|uniref:Putative 60S acidic ribosomal protein P2 n=1 Tax=Leishmania infantum TaxID=5671 RepID=A4HRV3_LEIIN|nr:putative 60S acidic ribosomal protein P2 [Leishmania infantum JPCM5]CAM60016.1 putative 60S acidic ribosomal protein P2 [Leishmania infantum JPCM5]|eukprot:XP_001462795.1 putative 60S acidic ribosomal protein P2 [Leishmania infantum JPCM5]
MSAETLACTYAALMLSDAGLPTSAENIAAAVKAAGVEMRPTLPIIFARFLEKKVRGDAEWRPPPRRPRRPRPPRLRRRAPPPLQRPGGKVEDKKDEPEEGGDGRHGVLVCSN